MQVRQLSSMILVALVLLHAKATEAWSSHHALSSSYTINTPSVSRKAPWLAGKGQSKATRLTLFPKGFSVTNLPHEDSSKTESKISLPKSSSPFHRFLRRRLLVPAVVGILVMLMSCNTASAASAVATTPVAASPTRVALAAEKLVASPIPRNLEIRLTGRLVYAALMGAAIGKERTTTQQHSAGIRTMSLVTLGAATFTLCSMFGFLLFPRYDAARMASNVASGVGFVGAGVITTTSASNDSAMSIVHGLTTATAIWMSAAIGVACGVGLYYIGTAATICTILILRFGIVKAKWKEVDHTDERQPIRYEEPLQKQKDHEDDDHYPNGRDWDTYMTEPAYYYQVPQKVALQNPTQRNGTESSVDMYSMDEVDQRQRHPHHDRHPKDQPLQQHNVITAVPTRTIKVANWDASFRPTQSDRYSSQHPFSSQGNTTAFSSNFGP